MSVEFQALNYHIMRDCTHVTWDGGDKDLSFLSTQNSTPTNIFGFV